MFSLFHFPSKVKQALVPMPLPVETTQQFQFGDRTVVYTLKRSRKARHVRLLITHEKGLQVTAPLRVSDRQVTRFVESKTGWITKTLDYYSKFPKFNEAQLLEQNATAKYLGEDCSVIATHNVNSSRPKATLSEKTITLQLPAMTPSIAKRCLEGWYKRQAREIIEQRVAQFAPQFGVAVGKIAIRGQRTRWGSCSSRGNLNFNWKLAMAPTEVIDYLVVHELSHMKELNHSKRFWNVVATHCPDYKTREHWLKQNGPLLSF